MASFLLALLIGFVAGLRSMVALAVVALAAHAGWLLLDETPLAFLGTPAAVCVLVVLAAAEMLHDMLVAAALGGSDGALWGGAAGGVLGALCGTLAGFDFRAWLADALGQDSPAALTENAVAIAGAALVMAGLA